MARGPARPRSIESIFLRSIRLPTSEMARPTAYSGHSGIFQQDHEVWHQNAGSDNPANTPLRPIAYDLLWRHAYRCKLLYGEYGIVKCAFSTEHLKITGVV